MSIKRSVRSGYLGLILTQRTSLNLRKTRNIKGPLYTSTSYIYIVEVMTDTPNKQDPRESEVIRADKSSPHWWLQVVPQIPQNMQDLLVDYAKIPPADLMPRLYDIRDKAWTAGDHPYPCIGRFRFLDLGMPKLDEYAEIVERVRAGEKILDLGCCFGQELRGLIHDAGLADTRNTFASDLNGEYWELGLGLFGDKDRIETTFVAADIFDESDGPGNGIRRFEEIGMDIIYAGSFLHLFEWDEQVRICKRLMRILEDKAGGLIVGKQSGLAEAKEVVRQTEWGTMKAFIHNDESFKRMWRQAEEETGVKMEVEVNPVAVDTVWKRMPQFDEGHRRFKFAVRRL